MNLNFRLLGVVSLLTGMISLSPCLAAEVGVVGKGHSNLEISEARVFAPRKGSNTTAAYAILKNTSDKPMQITFQKMAPFKSVEIHESLEKDGRMAMQKLESLTIPAKSLLELKPGSHHFMLFDATASLKEGEMLTGQLSIDGQATDISFKVVPR